VGSIVKIWKEKSNIEIEFEFQPPNRINILRANLNYNGREIIIKNGTLFYQGSEMRGNTFTDSGIGLGIP
jgi:hypothetical protein